MNEILRTKLNPEALTGGKRPLVVEHRVTLYVGPWTVRFWIEADVDYGGLFKADADRICYSAVLKVDDADPQSLALQLLDRVHAANSVEVCDVHGNGTCVHRDWP
jgi:hypothetical protein